MNKERTNKNTRRIIAILSALLITAGCYAGVMAVYRMANPDQRQDEDRLLSEEPAPEEEEEDDTADLEEEELKPSAEKIRAAAEEGRSPGSRRERAGTVLSVSRDGNGTSDGISGGPASDGGIVVPAPVPEKQEEPVPEKDEDKKETPKKPEETKEPEKPDVTKEPEKPEVPVEQNIINVEKSGIVNVYGVHYAVLAFGEGAASTDGYSYYLSGKRTDYVTYIDQPKTGVKIELPDSKARTLEVKQGDESLAVIKLGAVGGSEAAAKSVYDGELEIVKIAPETVIGDRLMYIYTSCYEVTSCQVLISRNHSFSFISYCSNAWSIWIEPQT